MDNVTTPGRPESLVKLPWAEEVFVCPKDLSRWLKKGDAWSRDYHGEADWEKMAKYVGKTYDEVAQKEVDYAVGKSDD
jgi:hypothetical protein